MSLIDVFEFAFKREIAGESHEFTLLLENVLDGKYEEEDLLVLAKHIENIFFDINITQRNSIFFLLMKVSRESAYSIARQALKETYETTRQISGHLFTILASIDDFEHFLRASGAMDVEKNLRIAYALINGIEIIDGDFNPSAPKKRALLKRH